MSTIAAISTPQAAGGIGIIRVSGEAAIPICELVFQSAGGKKLADLKGYTASYGFVYARGHKIDEAIALVFRAPHSYTGEDVVELSCHGGLVVLQETLRALFFHGAKPAEAGEFTKRAFLHGKMDLTQAEAVMKLIGAQGEQAARAALSAREGALRGRMEKITQSLLSCAAELSAWVDYPDEEIPELEEDALHSILDQAKKDLKELLDHYGEGQAVTEGVDTVIAGRPNAGKSTLMNLLAGRERSIVTEIAGTTRDVVEDTVRLGNVVLRLADTAGLRRSGDQIEQIGIGIARRRLEQATLILAVFDASQKMNEEDRELVSLCKGRMAIAVINKNDLEPELDDTVIHQNFTHVVELSASQGEGLDALVEEVSRLLGTQDFDPAAPMLANERQRHCCQQALDCIGEGFSALDSGLTLDAVNVSIDGAISALLDLTGEKANEAVVDQIFSQFCVGK